MTDNSAQGPTFKDVRNFDSTKCQMFTTYDTKQKNFTKISSRIRIYFFVPVASATRKVKQLEKGYLPNLLETALLPRFFVF